MPPAGLKPTVPASERPQTHALDRAATQTGEVLLYNIVIKSTSILFLSFRRVLNVNYSFLGNSPASEF